MKSLRINFLHGNINRREQVCDITSTSFILLKLFQLKNPLLMQNIVALGYKASKDNNKTFTSSIDMTKVHNFTYTKCHQILYGKLL